MSDRPYERASDKLILELHGDVKVLCKQMEMLCGNGQPGLIANIENRVDSLESTRTVAQSWVKGIAWVIGTLLAATGVAAAFWK